VASDRMPHVDLALIEYLEKTNPDKMIINLDTLRDPLLTGRIAGKVELVRHLRQLYEDQVKSSLTAGFAKD